ncbi:MAG: hypothetical protein ABIT38_10375, partial [Gemmatimonadaceae bacterium]
VRKPRPVLFVMDPRGRGVIGLEVFRATATRLGWIVLSSYETASDDPKAPNVDATNAMLEDAQGRWVADMRRLYFAGFSGTARFAWDLAEQLRGNVAGVLMAAAGITPGSALAATVNGFEALPALAVTAGTTDMNWSEVRSTETRFAIPAMTSRFWYFAGSHSWPPPSIASDAIEWFESVAMRRGLAAPDSVWLSARRQRLSLRADSLQMAGAMEEALALYRELGSDADSVTARRARRSYDSLAATGTMKKYLERLAAAQREEQEAIRIMSTALADFRSGALNNDAPSVTKRLRIPQLQKDLTSSDSVRVLSSRRRLEHAMAILSFYEPRNLLAAGDTARAITLLRVAAQIDSARAGREARAFGFSRVP